MTSQGGTVTVGGTTVAIPTKPHKDPNPYGDGPTNLSRDPFLRHLQLKALAFSGRLIPTPTGPVLAFVPEGPEGAGGGGSADSGELIDWERVMDPIGPKAAEIWGGRDPKPNVGRIDYINPYIEALWTDAGEAVDPLEVVAGVMGGRPGPGTGDPIPPDPHASERLIGTVGVVASSMANPAGRAGRASSGKI